ncbi:MAG: YIP1 family protein [Desulfobacteraceae bacterium]|nr:YIP1 family protein [Desulfobacteraceae bacterium]
MTFELVCPYCQFSKEVPKEKIPVGTKRALCPRCGQRFAISIPEAAPRSVIDRAATDSEFKGPEEETQKEFWRRGAPWEDRSDVGLWQGIYQTFREALFSPGTLFSTMTYTGGMKEPLAFGLLVGSIGSMFSLFWQFLMFSGGIASFGLLVSDQLPIGLFFPVFLVVVPIFVTVSIFLYTTVLHLLLLMVKGGKNGYEATFRVVSYSQAAQMVGLVPLIGGWIGGIWQLIVQVIGLREIHGTSYLRVILAFLIPVVLLILLAIAVLIPVLLYFFGNVTVSYG